MCRCLCLNCSRTNVYTSIFKSKIFPGDQFIKTLATYVHVTLGLKIPNALTIRQTEDH